MATQSMPCDSNPHSDGAQGKVHRGIRPRRLVAAGTTTTTLLEPYFSAMA